MSFDYAISGSNQTVYTPGSKNILCRSFKIDLSVNNATTATSYTLGKLPKDSQIMFANTIATTAVSGTSVTAATLAVAANSSNLISGSNVFASALGIMNAATYITNTYGVSQTSDVTLTYTLTLTGGAVANAGIIWVNIYYVA